MVSEMRAARLDDESLGDVEDTLCTMLHGLSDRPLRLDDYDAARRLAESLGGVEDVSAGASTSRHAWNREPTENSLQSLEEDTCEVLVENADLGNTETESFEDWGEDLTSNERLGRIQHLLQEARAFLDYRLMNGVVTTVLAARRLAETEVHARRENSSITRSAKATLVDIFALLHLVESIEDHQVVTLHTDEISPWAAFAVSKKRLHFGAIVDGNAVVDQALEDESPEFFAKIREYDAPNLRDLQQAVEGGAKYADYLALRRQMVRALRMAVSPGLENMRVKSVAVAPLEDAVTFSALGLYEEALRMHGVCVDETPAHHFFLEAQDLSQSAFLFKVTHDAPPILLRYEDQIQQLHLAQSASELAARLRDMSHDVPDRPQFVMFRLRTGLWAGLLSQDQIALCRTTATDLGKVARLAQRFSESGSGPYLASQ